MEEGDFDQMVDARAMDTNLKTPPPRSQGPRRFPIFNDNYHQSLERVGGGRDENAFPLFGLLPAELRLKIWAMCLEQHRFLRIVLSHSTETTSEHQTDGTVRQDTLTSSGPTDDELLLSSTKRPTYRVFFSNTPPSSVLAEACLESARVARSFYSIPVPYTLTTPGETVSEHEKHGVAALNPDWDILDIHSSDSSPAAEHIVEFLHDLRTTDRRGRGTANLCIDHSQIAALAELDIPSLATPVLQSYKATVAGLHRLYWRTLPGESGRLMAGWPHHTQTLPWHNVSMPLMAADLSCPVVEFAGADPRPDIAPDLHQVWVGRDPRGIPALWAQVERNLGVCAGSQHMQGTTSSGGEGQGGAGLQCRVLLASEPRGSGAPMVDRAAVDAHLAGEVRGFCELLEADWSGLPLHSRMWQTALGRFAPDLDALGMSAEEVAMARVSTTAVGFWLLDPAALGPVPDDPITAYYQSKTVINMSELAIEPELCLFSLGG